MKKEQNNNEFKRKNEIKKYIDLNKLDMFIQSSLEKFKLVDPMKELYDATKNDANSIISHKSTIPDLVIWNKKFNKNFCFYDCDYTLNKENLFPRYQFFLRVKGTKNDKDKKKDKKNFSSKNSKRISKKDSIIDNEKKEKNKQRKEKEIKNLGQLLNSNNNNNNNNKNNNQNEMNKIVSKMKEIGINGDIKDSERIIPKDIEYMDDIPKKIEKNKTFNEKENEYGYDQFKEINFNKNINEKEDFDDKQDNNEINFEQINPMNNLSKDEFFNQNNEEQKPNFNFQVNNDNNLNDINQLLKNQENEDDFINNPLQKDFDESKKQKKKKST